jgi:hypothetical protein
MLWQQIPKPPADLLSVEAWRQVTPADIEAAGQQELLHWMCLVGAMEVLDYKPEIVAYIETYVLNSNKCLVVFRP